MARILKSVVYLASFTTLGYVLMKVTEPSPKKIEAIKASTYQDPQSIENRRKTELILKKLKESAYSSEPVHINNQTSSKPEEQDNKPLKREIN